MTRQDPLSAALATLHNTGSALRAVAGRAERDILADIIAAHTAAAGFAGTAAPSNQSGASLAGLDTLIRGVLQQPAEELKQMALDIKQEIAAFAAAREQLQELVGDLRSALAASAIPDGATVVSQADGEALAAERKALQSAVEQVAEVLPNSQVQVAQAGAASASTIGDVMLGKVDTGSNAGHPSSGLE